MNPIKEKWPGRTAVRERLSRLPWTAPRAVVALGACLSLWVVLSMAPGRIGYPGELEWMEGGVWGHVLRVTQGLPLYVEPSIEFTPYIYTPFYYWLCAGLSFVFGSSIALLRLVSLLSFVGSCLLIVYFVWKKTNTLLPGIIGAGLFAATFRLGGAWFDIARGDSLAVFLLLLGSMLLLCFDCRRSAISAGVVFALAFLTKQSALAPLAALSIWALACRTPRLAWFAGTAVGLVLFSWLVLHLTTGGWFTYYVFSLPSQHPLLEEWKVLFFTNDVLGVLAIGSLLLLFEVLSSVVPTKKQLLGSLGFVALVGGITAMVFSSRIHLGMYDNVLMPLHALIGLGVALALGRCAQNASFRALELACLFGVAGTFWKLEYQVKDQVPTPGHIEAYQTLKERLDAMPEGTWVPYHSTPLIQSNRAPRAHWMALIDVQRGGGPVAEKLTRDAEVWIKNQTAPTIVWSFHDPTGAWFTDVMRRYYRRTGSITGPSPLTGWGQRPAEIWTPRKVPKDDRGSASKRTERRAPSGK